MAFKVLFHLLNIILIRQCLVRRCIIIVQIFHVAFILICAFTLMPFEVTSPQLAQLITSIRRGF